MTVVVDVGCYHHPNHKGASQDSVSMLLERFRPTVLYGFDPHPDQPSATWFLENGTQIILKRKAAWTYGGKVAYNPHPKTPLKSRVGEGSETVPCFDLARFLHKQPEPVILKIDIEGAEYELLEHLMAAGAMAKVDKLLVEWHRQDIFANRTRQRRVLAGFVDEERW